MRTWLLILAVLAVLVVLPGGVLVTHDAPPKPPQPICLGVDCTPSLPGAETTARFVDTETANLTREADTNITCIPDKTGLDCTPTGPQTGNTSTVLVLLTSAKIPEGAGGR